MADERYLKRRGQTWFFEMAVPREVRGKYATTKNGKAIDKVVVSLKTRDIRVAQKDRWRLLADYTERFRRCAGDIALTRAEIFGQYCKNTSLSSIERSIAADFLSAIATLHPHWGRHPSTKDLTIWQLLERFGKGEKQLSKPIVALSLRGVVSA
jgi:hypothetical protein